MKKRLLLPLLTSLMLISCGGGEKQSESIASSQDQESSQQEKSSSSSIEEKEFTGLSFENLSVPYDGKEHILKELSGAPEGSKVTYTNRNSYTDVGSYQASVTVSKEGYKTKTITATLTITPIDFAGFTYESKSVKYDGTDHINDVQLVGVQPDGTSVKQTVKDANGTVVISAIEVGVYSYSVEITNKNYNKLTLNATLTIKAEKTTMPVFSSSDGTIYFANGLDNKYLYSYTSNAETPLARIDFSKPKEFTKNSSSNATFIAGAPFLNSVKEVSNGETNIIYTDSNIDDFVKYSESVYYYSKNCLTSSSSGIYKVDATNVDAEPIVTEVFNGKTDNLSVYNNYLYFTNGNDNDYLYKMNLTSLTTSLVLKEKVHEYIIEGNKLYCAVNGLLNDYIGYLDLASSSTSPTKLTDAAGEYLTIKNNKLYFNYTDLYGMIDESKYGVWSIDLSSKTSKQILASSGVNGFDIDSSSSLIYVDSTNLHLYKYNPTSGVTTDLLDGFVPPEVTPLNLGGRTAKYGNNIYYLNMYAGKTLYAYNEISKTNYQLTTNKVADFFIYGDKLYFNQVTMLTNNDLYCVDLKISSEAVKISTNDVRNMTSDGTYIYATHYNWAGVAGGLSRMKLDGSEYVKFSDINGAKNLTIKDGNLYFINCATMQDNGNIEYISLEEIDSESTDIESVNLSKNIKNVKQFIFDDNDIFYIYNGIYDNSVRRTDFSSLGEGTKIASSETNPNEILLNGEDVYYYSHPVTLSQAKSGFYKVSKSATKDGTQELILGYDKKYYGSELLISSDNLYFLNYIPKLVLGDAHFYQLNLNTKALNKIA